MILKKPRRPLKLKSPRVGCPFCFEWLPDAALSFEVFSGEGARGGRCSCGVVFVLDDTGKAGGQALLDVLALACDGDLDRAMKLDSDTDYELKTRPVMETMRSTGRQVSPGGHMPPKIWAVRLK